jgi:hypothetical protein
MNPIPNVVTTGQKYGPAMEIESHWEADAYFEALVDHQIRCFHKSREEAEAIERNNLGYFAGYYSNEVRERVERLFGCVHPYFGSIAQNGPPTPEQAFKMGGKLAEGSLKPQPQPAARKTIWDRLEADE